MMQGVSRSAILTRLKAQLAWPLRVLVSRGSNPVLSRTALGYTPYLSQEGSYAIPNSKDPSAEVCQYGLPVPPQDYRLGYGGNDGDIEAYLAGGRKAIETMTQVLNEAGCPIESKDKILEFGCGAGRLLRWLKPFSASRELWGTDLFGDRIIWCKVNLGDSFNFFQCTRHPHLPFKDGHFDLIFAGSVFSHIDDMADAWLMELRRICQSNGHVYITIKEETAMQAMKEIDPHKLESVVLRGHRKDIETFNAYRNQNFGFLALARSARLENGLPNVFYSRTYFERTIQPFFDVVSYTEKAYGWQTGVLLRCIGS